MLRQPDNLLFKQTFFYSVKIKLIEFDDYKGIGCQVQYKPMYITTQPYINLIKYTI